MQRDGIGLSLSGGGYRAMLFHTGVLWRMNELGMLETLDTVSVTSGGAITSGVLAHGWRELDVTQAVATRFVERIVTPIRSLASITVDLAAISKGLLKPFRTIGEELAAALRRELFGTFTMQDLPRRPSFVF